MCDSNDGAMQLLADSALELRVCLGVNRRSGLCTCCVSCWAVIAGA